MEFWLCDSTMTIYLSSTDISIEKWVGIILSHKWTIIPQYLVPTACKISVWTWLGERCAHYPSWYKKDHLCNKTHGAESLVCVARNYGRNMPENN